MRPLRIYVSGPLTTGGDVAANVRRAVLAGHELLAAGHLPFVPHLCHFADVVLPQPYERWMQFDLHWIEACHCVLRLEGDSRGADREVDRAKQLGIPVYYGLAACLEALPRAQSAEAGT